MQRRLQALAAPHRRAELLNHRGFGCRDRAHSDPIAAPHARCCAHTDQPGGMGGACPAALWSGLLLRLRLVGEQRGHHQPQGAPVTAGGAPRLDPAQQGRLRPVAGLGTRRVHTQASQIRPRIVEAGLPLPETIEAWIQRRQQDLQLRHSESGEGIVGSHRRTGAPTSMTPAAAQRPIRGSGLPLGLQQRDATACSN